MRGGTIQCVWVNGSLRLSWRELFVCVCVCVCRWMVVRCDDRGQIYVCCRVGSQYISGYITIDVVSIVSDTVT